MKLEKSLEQMSLPELRDLNLRVQAAIEPARQREKQAVLIEMDRIAKSRGLSVQDILGVNVKIPNAMPRDVVTHRDPISGKTWSGRGRPPHWVKEQRA